MWPFRRKPVPLTAREVDAIVPVAVLLAQVDEGHVPEVLRRALDLGTRMRCRRAMDEFHAREAAKERIGD